jgi:hypothetical protein
MAWNVTHGSKAKDYPHKKRRIKLNKRILHALYNVAVDAQLEYENSGSVIPWEETAQGCSFIELQDAISDALSGIDTDAYIPDGTEMDNPLELY